MLSSGFFLMTRSETAVTNLVLRYREWLKHALVTSLWLGQNTRWRPLKEGGVSLGSQFHSEEHHGEEVLEHDRMLTLHPPMLSSSHFYSVQDRSPQNGPTGRVSLPNSPV